MWKSLNPGESVTMGDVIRHISSQAMAAFGEITYEVVCSELHYFVIAPKQAGSDSKPGEPERRIIRYSDIGYHLGLEVWWEQIVRIA